MKKRIESAIRLILENSGEGWFIILEDPAEEKFVQFAYDEDTGLIFDLPFQALNTDELARAKQVLGEAGVGDESAGVFDGVDGEQIGEQRSFNAMVARDVDQAVDLVHRVFTYVYGFDEKTRFNVSIGR
ncbi:MAG: hypothetical protein CVV42_14660 [Candidatus Riflebacteria bacterium HGW-Riflebacteria-2]|jgi:hypothetical protein|nr:MAG: hypothetical protein CVV42_14660 [Candidatus Riflebacteria bacterium HGW-Riflebacteria-2]